MVNKIRELRKNQFLTKKQFLDGQNDLFLESPYNEFAALSLNKSMVLGRI